MNSKKTMNHSCGLLWIILISASFISLDILEPEGFTVICPLCKELNKQRVDLKIIISLVDCVFVRIRIRTCL